MEIWTATLTTIQSIWTAYGTKRLSSKRVNPSYIDLIPKVIPLEIFLVMVPSSSAYVPRALRGCFRGGFVRVSAKEKPPTLWGCLLLYKYQRSQGAFTLALPVLIHFET